jgi:hypothetical protein
MARLVVRFFFYYIILFFTALKNVNTEKFYFLKLCLDGFENLGQNWEKKFR